MKEIWKDVKGYEGLYQVSNIGNVKSLDRVVRYGRMLKGKEKTKFEEKDGYLIVCLSKNGKTKHMKVYRLVAMAFIENPLNLPEVNHKDENKKNNHFDNLEWCTTKHNINYGTRNSKVLAALSGEKSRTHKLSRIQVEEIRKLAGTVTRKKLAERYGVSVSQIGRILTNKEWKMEDTP